MVSLKNRASFVWQSEVIAWNWQTHHSVSLDPFLSTDLIKRVFALQCFSHKSIYFVITSTYMVESFVKQTFRSIYHLFTQKCNKTLSSFSYFPNEVTAYVNKGNVISLQSIVLLQCSGLVLVFWIILNAIPKISP